MIRYIRIGDLATDPGLTSDARIGLVIEALNEYALAAAMTAIHGPERGWKRYREIGGKIYQRSDGQPVIAYEDNSEEPVSA